MYTNTKVVHETSILSDKKYRIKFYKKKQAARSALLFVCLGMIFTLSSLVFLLSEKQISNKVVTSFDFQRVFIVRKQFDSYH